MRRPGRRVTEHAHEVEDLSARQRPASRDVLGELLALEELHRDPRGPRRLVDARRDDSDHVVALDARGGARLLVEPPPHPFVLGELRVHQLERAPRSGGELLGDVHRAHPALLEGAHDSKISAKDSSGLWTRERSHRWLVGRAIGAHLHDRGTAHALRDFSPRVKVDALLTWVLMSAVTRERHHGSPISFSMSSHSTSHRSIWDVSATSSHWSDWISRPRRCAERNPARRRAPRSCACGLRPLRWPRRATLSRRAGSADTPVAPALLLLPGSPVPRGIGGDVRTKVGGFRDDRVGVEVIVAAALEVLRVRAGKVAWPLRGHLQDARRELGHEPSIVRHEEHRTLECLQSFDQRMNGLEIEMVGGLVEDEQVGLLRDDPAEDEARGLAPRESSDGLFDVVSGVQVSTPPELPSNVARTLERASPPRGNREPSSPRCAKARDDPAQSILREPGARTAPSRRRPRGGQSRS